MLCAGLKIIFEKTVSIEKGSDISLVETSIESNLSLDKETRYSLAKGLTTELMDIKLAKEYFDRYKSMTAETVDMDFRSQLNLEGRSEESLNDRGNIAFHTRLYIVDKAIEEFLPNKKELLAHLFELIIFDKEVPQDDSSLDYESLQLVIRRFVHCDEELYWNHLSQLFERLFKDEDLGSFAARESALTQMSLRKDKAIVPVLKRLYSNPLHECYRSAELTLYSAIQDFPDSFCDSKYLNIKKYAGRSEARMVSSSS